MAQYRNNNYQFSPYRADNNQYHDEQRRFKSNYRRGGYENPLPAKKHSGCKAGLDKNGNPYVRGWKYDKRNGMRSFFAAPYKDTAAHKSGSGREWHNWMVRISQEGQKDLLTSGLYDPISQKVTLTELSFVMNPRAANGGYLGTFIRHKNRN